MATALTRLCTVPTTRGFANYVEVRLRRSSSILFPSQSVVDPADVGDVDVRPGLSDSDHYGVHYMPSARAEYNVIIIGANLPGKLINVPGLVVGDLV